MKKTILSLSLTMLVSIVSAVQKDPGVDITYQTNCGVDVKVHYKSMPSAAKIDREMARIDNAVCDYD